MSKVDKLRRSMLCLECNDLHPLTLLCYRYFSFHYFRAGKIHMGGRQEELQLVKGAGYDKWAAIYVMRLTDEQSR